MHPYTVYCIQSKRGVFVRACKKFNFNYYKILNRLIIIYNYNKNKYINYILYKICINYIIFYLYNIFKIYNNIFYIYKQFRNNSLKQ